MSDKQKETRSELEETVNTIFKKIYHGDRIVNIDDEFNIITIPLNGQHLSASGGTESVKNFSFVAGLLKLIKSHLLAKANPVFAFQQDDKYPLVLDAPFSGVDREHIQNVCRILPENCDQVIVVLLKDAYDNAINTLECRIGKKYHINKLSETCSELVED